MTITIDISHICLPHHKGEQYGDGHLHGNGAGDGHVTPSVYKITNYFLKGFINTGNGIYHGATGDGTGHGTNNQN